MKRCLNIGCGEKVIRTSTENWVNADIEFSRGIDVVFDATRTFPFLSAQFDHVLADNVLEHFDNAGVVNALNEIDRVLKLHGTVQIIVPHFRSQAAVQDPTHRTFFAPRSCMYWNQEMTPYGGRRVGITANLLPDAAAGEPVRTYGDMETEAFIEFRLRKM